MKIVVSKPLVGFNQPEKGTIAIVSKAYSSEKTSTETSKPSSSSSNREELITNSKENELKSTRAQMVEVKEENKRLKSLLARIMEDYKSLQSQLMNEPQGENEKSGAETSSTTTVPDQETLKEEEADDLVSLSLGTSSNVQRKGEKNKGNRTSDKTTKDDDDDVNMNTGLTLGFDCKPVRSNSSVAEDHQNQKEQKEEEIGDQPWTPSKILKVVDHRLRADEVSQHIHVKKARVSVRARCDGPTMSDGCQWRKYGQKISKGNPCPRAYYRCTVAPSCPVRKQVQRCADDTSILITTYEGTHDHPLPRAATAMASTTSAAANMIVSGSSATHPSMTSPTLMAPINALTFKSDPNPIQPYLSSITASPHYPTITLDLTSPPSNPSPPKPFTTQINRFSNSQPRFMFSSSSSLDSISPTTTSPWGVNGYLGFGSNQTYHNNNKISNFSQQQSPLFLQKPNVDQRSTSGNLTDTIAKAITTDPSFQSALATAVTSFVSNRKDGGGNDRQSLGQNLKWGSSVNNLSSGGFLDRIGGGSDANLPKGSMIFHQSSNGFSNGKISSGLSVEKKEQRS